MSNTSRRSLLSAASIAAASLCIPVTADAAMILPAPALPTPLPESAAADARLFELWQRRRDAAAAERRASAQYDAAEAKMPAWARPGFRFVDRDGKPVGDEFVAWPAIEFSAAELAASAFPVILARPCQATIAQEWASNARRMSYVEAKKLRDQALADYRRRRRRQTAEERKAKLPALGRAVDAACEHVGETEVPIQRMEPCTPPLIAALSLIEIGHECEADETADTPRDGTLIFALRILGLLRPHLHGAIGAEVVELLDNPSKPIGEMALWPHRRLPGVAVDNRAGAHAGDLQVA